MKYKTGKDLLRPTDIIELLLSESWKYLRKESVSFETVKSLVHTRFKSKYAKNRWGVEEVEMPDGTIKRYVPKEKLYLWKNNPNYRGRAIKNNK